MLPLEAIVDRLRTARLVARALELVKELGPYAAIELLLPGGSLIALGLWLYSRHKSGKPLLPFGFGGLAKISVANRMRSSAHSRRPCTAPCEPAWTQMR